MKNLEKRLSGKKALVTGAGSGLGRAIALRFANEGADVAVNDLNLEAAQETAKMINEMAQKSLVLQADVTNSEQVQKMVTDFYASSDFGELDILVNNAGIGGTMTEVIRMPDEKWDRIIRVNLRSVFLMCKYFGQKMRKQKTPDDQLRGKIINMSSMRGKRGRAKFGAYSAAKFGVVSLTQTLAIELGKYRITVNAICPGLIHTPIYGNISYDNLAGMSEPICLKHKPVGLPEDVAGVAFFIASDDANWITGQSFPISGGMHFV